MIFLAQVSMVIVLLMVAESEPVVFVELISKEIIRYHHVFGFHDQMKSDEHICEEINEVVLKVESIRDSPAKVQWAYDYLIKCINSLENKALEIYNATVKDGDNSMPA